MKNLNKLVKEIQMIDTQSTIKYPPVLTIAGSDSSGGAGIQADLKTMTSLGCYGMSVITALTAQNTTGVQGVFPVPATFVLDQILSVFDDIPPVVVKIGMLHDIELIEKVHGFLKNRNVKLVLDPVMVATSGDPLLDTDALDGLQELLFPLATLITPNVHEMNLISGGSVSNEEELAGRGAEMAVKWDSPFLVKGGDLKGANSSSDVLVLPGRKEPIWYEGKRVKTRNTHGTGCTLSSAIASHLALGFSLEESIGKSKKYIHSALMASKDQPWGAGHGPVNHMWNIK